MRRMSCSKFVFGFQPSTRSAFAGEPMSRSTSAGRMSESSIETYCYQSGRPAWSKAISTHSRTVFVLPVAMTKSSGVSCCSLSLIALT